MAVRAPAGPIRQPRAAPALYTRSVRAFAQDCLRPGTAEHRVGTRRRAVGDALQPDAKLRALIRWKATSLSQALSSSMQAVDLLVAPQHLIVCADQRAPQLVLAPGSSCEIAVSTPSRSWAFSCASSRSRRWISRSPGAQGRSP